MNRAWFQTLFERVADDYHGEVHCEEISDLGCTLAFRNSVGTVMVRAHVGAVEAGGRVLAAVARPGDGHPPVLVSPITSAVIAVCTR